MPPHSGRIISTENYYLGDRMWRNKMSKGNRGGLSWGGREEERRRERRKGSKKREAERRGSPRSEP